MDLLIAGALGLLIVAILVTIAARRLALPYTVRLVAAGAQPDRFRHRPHP